MTGRGDVQLGRRGVDDPELPGVFATTSHGARRLRGQRYPDHVKVEIVGSGDRRSPEELAAFLGQFKGHVVLCEGGPHLLGGLVDADVVDELFLTVAPQLIGRGADRLTLLEGIRLAPDEARWQRLVASDHDGVVMTEAEDRSPSMALPATALSSRRHGLIAALATVAVLVGVPIAMVTHEPSWTLRPITFASPGEGFQPRGWSPDGTRFLFSRLDQFVVVRIEDSARVFTGYGAWPIWVDNDTIDALQDIGLGRSRIAQMSLSGQTTRGTLPPIFETAKLVGDGPLETAATTSIGSTWASVVDPQTGRIVAQLPGVRAVSWAGIGRLITKTSEPSPGVQGSSPGHLRAWTARDGLRPIGGDLFEIAEFVSPAPSGDVIACVCARPSDGPQSAGSIDLLPVDGGPPRRLFDLNRGDVNIQTNFGWLPDGSLLVLDGIGFHRFSLDGVPLAVPAIPATDMPTSKCAGRAYVVGGDIIIASQLGSATTGTSRLTIRHLDGTVLMARTFPSWNGLGMVPDHDRSRALVMTDPQAPSGPPDAFFVLERL